MKANDQHKPGEKADERQTADTRHEERQMEGKPKTRRKEKQKKGKRQTQARGKGK